MVEKKQLNPSCEVDSSGNIINGLSSVDKCVKKPVPKPLMKKKKKKRIILSINQDKNRLPLIRSSKKKNAKSVSFISKKERKPVIRHIFNSLNDDIVVSPNLIIGKLGINSTKQNILQINKYIFVISAFINGKTYLELLYSFLVEFNLKRIEYSRKSIKTILELTQDELNFGKTDFKRKIIDKKCLSYPNLTDPIVKECFNQYFEETEKIPNIEFRLIEKFYNWLIDRNQYGTQWTNLNKFFLININQEIKQFVMDRILNSSKSIASIQRKAKIYGIKLSEYSIIPLSKAILGREGHLSRFPTNKPKERRIFNQEKLNFLNLENSSLLFTKYKSDTGRYPNYGPELTLHYRSWLLRHAKDSDFNTYEKINSDLEIIQYMIHCALNTKLTLREIELKIRNLGIKSNRGTLKSNILGFSTMTKQDFSVRFPKPDDHLTDELISGIIHEVKNSNLNVNQIAIKYNVGSPTVSKISLDRVFKDLDKQRERFPINQDRELGKLSHSSINILLTELGRRKKFLYFSEVRIFPPSDKRADGFIVNNSAFLRRNIKLKLSLNPFFLSNIVGFHFDYTTDSTERNLISKCVSYLTSNVFSFIIDIGRFCKSNLQTFFDRKDIKYRNNVRLISPSLFSELTGLSQHKDLIILFKKVLYHVSNKNIFKLRSLSKKISYKYNNILNNTSDLKKFFIERNQIRSKLSEIFYDPEIISETEIYEGFINFCLRSINNDFTSFQKLLEAQIDKGRIFGKFLFFTTDNIEDFKLFVKIDKLSLRTLKRIVMKYAPPKSIIYTQISIKKDRNSAKRKCMLINKEKLKSL